MCSHKTIRIGMSVVACLTGLSMVAFAQSKENVQDSIQTALTLPLMDYTHLDAYWNYESIEDAGYFAVGRRYVHAPRVEWKPVRGVASYKIVLMQKGIILGVTPADHSPVYAENGWDKIQPGKAGIAIIGCDSQGHQKAISRLFPFYAAPDFDPATAAAKKQSYRQAAVQAFEALYNFKMPNQTPAPTEGPGSKIKHHAVLTAAGTGKGCSSLSFPNTHDWTYVAMCENLDKIADGPIREKIRSFAESVGDHLLMCRLQEPDYMYAGLIRGCVNWNGEPSLGFKTAKEEERQKQIRLIEPAKCGYSGEALVKLYEMTGKQDYLDAAEVMAETLVKTQLPNGAWHARVDGKTGEPLGSYSTSVISVAAFMDRLNQHRPDPRWIACRDKAMQWMANNPFRTFAWVVNYDDGPAKATEDNPYIALSNWDLFAAVRYLEKNRIACPDSAAVVREHLRWNDNHFVFYGDDPLLAWDPFYPTCAEQGNPASYYSWADCWLPMDFHTANWGLALLAAYKITQDPMYLQKAKAAGNALTQYQIDNGATITWMPDKTTGLSGHLAGDGQASHSLWPSAWALSAAFWAQLVEMECDQ